MAATTDRFRAFEFASDAAVRDLTLSAEVFHEAAERIERGLDPNEVGELLVDVLLATAQVVISLDRVHEECERGW